MKVKVLRTQKVKLTDLKLNLFVRKELDQDRVWLLSELIENGVQMTDNIMVTKGLEIVDGRHRYEAYDLNKIEEVVVNVVDLEDEVDIIAAAYRANTGGSKPPTIADTEHTVGLLLARKQSIKAIAEVLGLPPATTRNFVKDIKSRLNRANLMNAVAAVTEGDATVAEAAELHDVDIDKLKEALSGTRKKHKQSRHGVEELQRSITFLYKSVASKNGNALTKLLEKYEDGDVTEKQVREILSHIKDSQKRASRTLADWQQRFEAKVAEKGSSKADAA